MQGPGEDSGGAAAGAAAADGGVDDDRALPPVETQSKFAERLKARLDALDPDGIEVWRFRHTNPGGTIPVFIALAQKFGLKCERLTGARSMAIDVTGSRNILTLFREHAWAPLRDTLREGYEVYLKEVVCPETGIEYDADAFDKLPAVTREDSEAKRIQEP